MKPIYYFDERDGEYKEIGEVVQIERSPEFDPKSGETEVVVMTALVTYEVINYLVNN